MGGEVDEDWAYHGAGFAGGRAAAGAGLGCIAGVICGGGVGFLTARA